MLIMCLLVGFFAQTALSFEWHDLQFADIQNISYPGLIIKSQGQQLKICHVENEGKVITNPRQVLSELTLKVKTKDASSIMLRREESRNQGVSRKLCWYQVWVEEGPTQRYVLIQDLPDLKKVLFETFGCVPPEDVQDINIDLATYLLKGHWANPKSKQVRLGSSAIFEVEFKWVSSLKDVEKACSAILARLKGYYPERRTLDSLLRHALETGVIFIVKCPNTERLYFLDDGKDNIIFELIRNDHGPYEHQKSVQKTQTYESALQNKVKRDSAFKEFSNQSVPLLNEEMLPKRKLLFGCFPICW